MENKNYKKFKYQNYENCYFVVNSYLADKKAMAIAIENDEGPITYCTVYEHESLYSENITVIKNYSENSHLTEFLKKLGIVIDIIYRVPCNRFSLDSLNGDNPQTFDTCIIDTDKLKEYCKIWNYNV